ncbi:hypothetical protein [Azospirillum rugosum]|uniref:Uncharacterized protein n=1 Tax=Azospirillum rugosum TaxID=416170 RepID=A0ABS4SQ56_9PROT|nr:hypothetical protein [Azospirillum rugosum]MBP2294364.1 hypothetical protein [Azospirillum rugosum]MDQ0527699.1 hypothetical protein [Azospirillum rugosum]
MRTLVSVVAVLGSTMAAQAAQPNWAWSPEFYYTPNAAKECEFGNKKACGDLSLSTLPQTSPMETMGDGGYGYGFPSYGLDTAGPSSYEERRKRLERYLYLRPNPFWPPPGAPRLVFHERQIGESRAAHHRR